MGIITQDSRKKKINLRKKLGKERTGDGGRVLGEGEELVRVHALLEDLL